MADTRPILNPKDVAAVRDATALAQMLGATVVLPSVPLHDRRRQAGKYFGHTSIADTIPGWPRKQQQQEQT